MSLVYTHDKIILPFGLCYAFVEKLQNAASYEEARITFSVAYLALVDYVPDEQMLAFVFSRWWREEVPWYARIPLP